jgi:hypothetical protein
MPKMQALGKHCRQKRLEPPQLAVRAGANHAGGGNFQKNVSIAFSTSATTIGVTGAARFVIVVNESGNTAAA